MVGGQGRLVLGLQTRTGIGLRTKGLQNARYASAYPLGMG